MLRDGQGQGERDTLEVTMEDCKPRGKPQQCHLGALRCMQSRLAHRSSQAVLCPPLPPPPKPGTQMVLSQGSSA